MIELLAPAGDLEKLKVALLYGADAVFVGGQNFSLRARASNFTIADIEEACRFAHSRGKKVYVTTNIIPHHEDLEGILEYLKALEKARVDAIISASPSIIDVALRETSLEVHLSTQQSVYNTNTVNFWFNQGIKRIVLARELDKSQIAKLIQGTEADIEVFIHGGMCMSFSGRCSLSDNFTLRDANRGGCAHSCRWNYQLRQNNQTIHNLPFSMSSKDLATIEQIPFLIDAGVKSLKIEGRMKSLHYIATVVSTYRKLIDDYKTKGTITDFSPYQKELDKAENRLTSFGYLEGLPGIDQQLFNQRSEKPTQQFIGLGIDYDEKTKRAKIEQRNHFTTGMEIEVFNPSGNHFTFILEKLFDEDYQEITIARHPKQLLYMETPQRVEPYAMIRRVS